MYKHPHVKGPSNKNPEEVERLFSGYLKLGVLGTWMTFKKVEMTKTLRNGLSRIETNPLNHNWTDFAI